MLPRLLAVTALVAAALAGSPAPAHEDVDVAPGADDVVVIAVIDDAITPYHWDFAAERMPQQLDDDADNDLPLSAPPHTWLTGFPDPDSAFAGYASLELSLSPDDPAADSRDLDAIDSDTWSTVGVSTADAIRYYWIPGTKVIGAIDFGGGLHAAPSSGGGHAHGAYTSSVAVGNVHGTCPECLLVFISYGGDNSGEAAIEWALSQPWIDAISNSYGFSLVARDRLYSGSDVTAQRRASERGQTVFFSAGNGQDGAFVVPNTTYFSSQEGPDWIVTVGAVSPSEAEYTGSGRPADVAAPGGSYPSLGGTQVSGDGTFGGTSNATPVVAGLYAHALSWARTRLAGPSRIQDAGVVASGAPVPCASARPACELADGRLTATELRTRLLHGARHTGYGPSPNGIGQPPAVLAEDAFMVQGHGAYLAKLDGDLERELEELERLLGPMDGSRATETRPSGEREWFVVDSFCRQHLWGSWTGGYHRAGETPLPPPDPRWPARTALAAACPSLFPPV